MWRLALPLLLVASASACEFGDLVYEAMEAARDVAHVDIISQAVRNLPNINSTQDLDEFLCSLPDVSSVEEVADMLGLPRMEIVTAYDMAIQHDAPQKILDGLDILLYILPDLLNWGFPQLPLQESASDLEERAHEWVDVLGSDFIKKLLAVAYLGAPPGIAVEGRDVTGEEMASLLQSSNKTVFIQRLTEVSGIDRHHAEGMFGGLEMGLRFLDGDKLVNLLEKVRAVLVAERDLGLMNLPYDDANVRPPFNPDNYGPYQYEGPGNSQHYPNGY